VRTYRSGQFSEARSVVVGDLDDIPLVSVEFFLSSALPPVEEAILDQIKTKLKSQKHIIRNRWACFSKPPKATGKKEVKAFEELPTIFRNVVVAADPIVGRKPVLTFEYKPNETPLSERNNNSRPDAHLELVTKKSGGSKTRSQASRWEDIVFSWELKLDIKGCDDVRSMLLLRSVT
jgi:hypothetical protein